MSAAADSASPRLTVCPRCDWVMRLPARAPGEAAHCPRCHHHMAAPAQADLQAVMAWAGATLVLLALVFGFDFLSFSTHGIGHTMTFLDAARSLVGTHDPALALVLVATTVALPGLYLVALLYVCLSAGRPRPLPGTLGLARPLRGLQPWMMSDVFIVGVLVSLIKIVALAQIHIGTSFVAFCAYSLALMRTFTLIDWIRLWDAIAPAPEGHAGARTGATAAPQRLVACRACGAAFAHNAQHRCPRCGKHHLSHRFDRLQLTWALLVTASLLYIPANIYPILTTTTLGHSQGQTIIGGVVHLAEAGSWPIAAIIFVASIVVPISKIVALAWLCLRARARSAAGARRDMRLYHLTEQVGRWSMIDVFVVAVLGSLVQAGALMSIRPGPAALSFAAVVVLTMIAALTFDTRLLWSDRDPVEAP